MTLSSTGKLVGLILMVLLLAACAGRQTADQRSGEVYLRHAGSEVEQVRYASVRGWQPVGDEAILLDLAGRGDYLLTLSADCHFDLRFSPRIALDTQLRGVLTRFDRVIVNNNRCRILSIRPVDMDAVRADLAEQAESQQAGQPLRPVDSNGSD
ncbi:MAG: DUF6491 family protein [Wenzhouxiangella sp.]